MKNNNKFIRLLVMISALTLAGCQQTPYSVYLMPTPTGISTGAHDPFANTPEEEKSGNILVGYGTNRLPIGAREARFYMRNFDEDIRMGVVTIQIGDGTKTWGQIRELSRDGARKDQILLTMANVREISTLGVDASLETLTPEVSKMMSRFNQYIEKSPNKEVTVYVHGADNNFYRSAAQAAQYRHFTGRQAVVLMFSWPSAENILHYGTDVRNIRETIPTFIRYLRLLAKHSTARKINILAYSAGATLVSESLAVLAEDSSVADRQAHKESLRIGTVYFAAPDTDFDDWVKQYRSYQDIVDSVTVTINMKDSVLAMAQEDRYWKATGGREYHLEDETSKSRLGRPDLGDISTADAEWLLNQTKTSALDVIIIDSSIIPGIEKGSHSFWYQSPWVSTDALLDLNFHANPADRGLADHETKRGTLIWYFPSDYEQRITNAINKLSEEYDRSRSGDGF